MAAPPFSVQVPSKRSLARVSRQSTNDKDDNEMIPKAVHISPGIYLQVRNFISEFHGLWKLYSESEYFSFKILIEILYEHRI